MTHSYISGSILGHSLRRMGLTALLAGGTALAAQAQFTYGVASATNVAGTFTDLGTTGAVITTTNNDDANSAAQAIGFSFTYNGAAFTQFVLNTNGAVRLGAAAPSVANLFANYEGGTNAGVDPITSTSTSDVNLLMPFNFDLTSGTGGAEYRVVTTGTAPNRVCTVQWKNVADKADVNATQYASFTFQLKLYETSNLIEFVYGTATASTGTAAVRFPTIGIKGSSSTADVLASKTASTSAWSTTTFITGTYGTTTHNFRSTVGPDAGRTYRFATAVANDAAVATIYTLGKIATPSSLPHSVRAVVTNAGSAALTSIPVTLAVTGANTFSSTQTIASLAVGASATVTFAAYPTALTVGTNNITVSVPADGNNTNNTATYTQLVSTNRILVADPALTNTTALSYSSTATGGVLASKFTISASTKLTDAVISFGTGSTATTSYQVVVYDATGTGGAPGTLLFTSPAQARPAAGGPVTVTMANTQVPTNFFIGVKEAGVGGSGIATQPESPLRAGTFYASADGSTAWFDVATSTLQYRLLIEAGVTAILGTSPELTRAVTIYPNPSETGVFNLDIRNANASGALGVEVTNQLGQRVYTGSAHDNFRTTVDLSNLAGGLYHLQVRNGAEFTSQQISIVK